MHVPTEEVLKNEMDRVRGRLCGFIEALGLEEKQERGAIATIKSLTYDCQKEVAEAIVRERAR